MTAQPENVIDFEPPARPIAKVIFVTPETAQRWLDRNPKNRNVRPLIVKKYARDMAAGNWHLTGDSVKFSPDGDLLDGQHRLEAIVASGATVPTFVVRGIHADAQRAMDTGRARTASDALRIRGDQNTAPLAAAARVALGIEADLPDPGKYDATHAEIEAFVDENPRLREAASFAATLARRTDCPPALVAYSYFRMAEIDRAAAGEFWAAAADKVGLNAGDPVIAMTNRFAEARRNRERLSKRAYLSVIFRAWNYRRAGKSLRLAKIHSPSGGVVPIPDPR